MRRIGTGPFSCDSTELSSEFDDQLVFFDIFTKKLSALHTALSSTTYQSGIPFQETLQHKPLNDKRHKFQAKPLATPVTNEHSNSIISSSTPKRFCQNSYSQRTSIFQNPHCKATKQESK